ncbi:unnamed protein product [Cuscuta campestris]|uniref:NADPH-dependent diflavin oxidoreductase 1 n=1 Tax=Cuscuta campestris TaxID=132261 RepID=A0A484M3Z2_9ASTE|nr:unnamed protein product [Cuscuta campestris]
MEEKTKNKLLLVLYASQTGNAIDVAERLGREAELRGCPALVLSVDEYDPASLPNEEIVIFVVSTTGQGDTPDSMKVFWRFLLKRSLSQSWLKNVKYAVFGLGDSGYQKYNYVAKKLDKRLLDLGATPVIEKGLGDDQHPSGYEGAFDPWMSSLWNVLHQSNPMIFPNGLEYEISYSKLREQPKINVTYHDANDTDVSTRPFSMLAGVTVADLNSIEVQIGRARSMSPGTLSEKIHPDCFLRMVKTDLLCKAGCGKDVHHLELEPVSLSIQYEVGDVLEVLPGQSAASVDAFIKRCNLNPDSYITVHPRDKDQKLFDTSKCSQMLPVKLRTFVELTMDISSASPRRYFFEIMSYFATSEHEKERLQYFASPEGRDDLYQYNQKERRTVLEVLVDFPSVQMPFEWLVQLVPPLKTRAFSISSSPLVHPNQVHLTVSVVAWTTPYGRKRKGLCSSWLAGLDPQQGELIPAWFSKGSLPPPPPSLPLILVGPGTGCAPLRGFIEERALQSQSGNNTAPVIFFFGCRNEENDFLYRDFWQSHSQSGKVLCEEQGGGFFVAFSRDQPQKVYVQHKMREQSVKVWNLLAEGAAVYVAGSASKMPSDVLSALEEIVSEVTGESRETSMRWLRRLEREGKYHVEAWS